MNPDRAFWITIAVCAIVAMLGCIPLFVDIDAQGLLVLAFPGMFMSAMLTNIHDPNPYFAFVFAWGFWVLVFVIGRKIWETFRAS